MVCKNSGAVLVCDKGDMDLFLYRFLSSLFAPVEMTWGLATVGMNLLKTND